MTTRGAALPPGVVAGQNQHTAKQTSRGKCGKTQHKTRDRFDVLNYSLGQSVNKMVSMMRRRRSRGNIVGSLGRRRANNGRQLVAPRRHNRRESRGCGGAWRNLRERGQIIGHAKDLMKRSMPGKNTVLFQQIHRPVDHLQGSIWEAGAS